MTTSHVSEGGSLAAEKRLLQIEIALFAKAGEWDKENWGHATKASMFLRQTANDIHYATNIIRALESPAESVRLAEMVDNLDVWCAVCQKNMKLVTGPNVVHGWYSCDQVDSPCATHAVVLNLLKASSSTEGSK